MSFHSAHQAEAVFIQTIRNAVRCVDSSAYIVPSDADARGVTTLALATGEPLKLRTAAAVSISIALRYRVVPVPKTARYRVSTHEYVYTIHDALTEPILAYHWHPFDRRGDRHPAPYPHLHLYASAGTLRSDIRDAHLVTGRLALEEVLACIIETFDVRPANGNWRSIFAKNIRRFVTSRSWPRADGIDPYRIV